MALIGSTGSSKPKKKRPIAKMAKALPAKKSTPKVQAVAEAYVDKRQRQFRKSTAKVAKKKGITRLEAARRRYRAL